MLKRQNMWNGSAVNVLYLYFIRTWNVFFIFTWLSLNLVLSPGHQQSSLAAKEDCNILYMHRASCQLPEEHISYLYFQISLSCGNKYLFYPECGFLMNKYSDCFLNILREDHQTCRLGSQYETNQIRCSNWCEIWIYTLNDQIPFHKN